MRGHSDSGGGTVFALCFHTASFGGGNCADNFTSNAWFPTASGIWGRYDVVRVVPAGMHYAYVQFQWAVWYDDVLIEDLDAPGHEWPAVVDSSDFESGSESDDDRQYPGTWVNDGSGPTGAYLDANGGHGPRYATKPGHRYEVTMDALTFSGGGSKWVPCFVATNNAEYWHCGPQSYLYPDLLTTWTTRSYTLTAPAGDPTYLAIDFAYHVRYDNLVVRDLDAPDAADELVPAEYPFPVRLTYDPSATSTTLDLVAIDRAGLRSAATPAAITLDNTPPSLQAWITPDEPKVFTDWTAGHAFAWSVTDAGAGYRQAEIELQRTPLASGTCGVTWSWVTGTTVTGTSWQSGALERNHCYRLRVRLHDIVGNVGEWVASPAISVPEAPLPTPPGFAPGDIHSPIAFHPYAPPTSVTDNDESTAAFEAYPSAFIRIDYGTPITVRGVLMDQQEGSLTYPIGGFGKSSAAGWQLQYLNESLGQYVVAHQSVGYAEQYRFNLATPVTARHWQIVMTAGAWDGPSHRNAWIVEELHMSAQPVTFLPPTAQQLRGLCRTGHSKCPVRFEKDPVNTATGNFASAVTDLSLPGRGLGFAFTRTYNSADPTVTVLGPGWRHSYDARLAPHADGTVRFFAEDGVDLLYQPAGAGKFVTPNGTHSSLVQLGDGTFELTRRDQVRYRFSSTGRLTALVDRNANQLTFGYTGNLLTSVTDAVGRVVSLSYVDGRLSTLSGPPNRSVAYGYDPSGRLFTVTDATGQDWTYTYDPGGRLETITDPNGHDVLTNEYGPDGRVSAQTDATGNRGTFAWDPVTQTSTYTDANLGTWQDVYTGGVLSAVIDPLDHASTYTYDADFNVLTATDPRGHTTSMTYDDRGNLLTRTAPAPLGYEESWTYNARNDVVTFTDGREHSTTNVYDPAGNLIRVEAPLNAVTEFGRDPAGTGLLVSLTDARDKTTTFGYDAHANLNRTTSPLGHVTTMTYDPAGRMLTSVDPRGNQQGADPALHTTEFTYDGADRLLTVTDPLDHVTTNTYDPAGNLASVTDPNDHTTSYGYDAANRLTSVTDAALEVTAYAYDDVGNLVTRTDANDHITTYDYDAANRLATTTDPLDHSWTLTYDDAGNLATRLDANGETTTYTHDELSRLIATLYEDPATPDVSFGYDANGNLTNMVDGAGTETYAYDDLDRLTGVTRGSDAFGYDYDLAGNLTDRTYPGGSTTTYTFDDDGRLASATADAATTSYGYDAAGNVTTIATPDGYVARYAYDAAGRLAEVAHRTDTALLSRFSYTRDAAGNPTAMTTRTGTVSYRYDNLNRLTGACWAATCPWGAGAAPAPCLDCGAAVGVTRPADPTPPDPADTFLTWTYDPVGNRLTEATNTGTTTYTYDPADRLTSRSGAFPGSLERAPTSTSGTWSSGASGYASDNSYATVAPPKNATRAQRYGGFGFSAIPVGATIDRVTVTVEWAVSSASAQATLAAQAVSAGSLVGTPLTNTTEPTTDTVQSFDVTGLTRAQLAGAFEVEVRASRGGGGSSFTARLDRVSVRVDYTLNAQSFTYDANGNQLTAGADTFSWDAADRLVGASAAGVTQTYTYAGDGRRLSVTSGGATTDWLWDLNQQLPQLALERDGGGQVVRRSTYGLGRTATVAGATTAYHHSDGLGSLVDLTSTTGSQLAWSEYQPFGAVRSSGLAPGAPLIPFGFTGEYLDPTGQLHLRARQYDPASGRFLSTDPLAPPLTDPYVAAYVYVGNMPTGAVDPSGRFLNIVAGFVGGTIAYGAGTMVGNLLQGQELTEGLNYGDAFMAGASGALMAGTAGLGLLVQTSVSASLGTITTAASMGLGGRRDPTELAWGALMGMAGPLADAIPISALRALPFRETTIGFARGVLTSTFLTAGQGVVSMDDYYLATYRRSTKP